VVLALLDAYDLELSVAKDGHEAVRLCGEAPFDLVLMDIRMPGMDGPDALRLIRAGNGPNVETPILAFTADADDEAVDALLAAGFDGHIGKPINGQALVASVGRWTGDDPWGGMEASNHA
jgi:CheY-like chemotaxis protein